jgi:hypothetical protein
VCDTYTTVSCMFFLYAFLGWYTWSVHFLSLSLVNSVKILDLCLTFFSPENQNFTKIYVCCICLLKRWSVSTFHSVHLIISLVKLNAPSNISYQIQISEEVHHSSKNEWIIIYYDKNIFKHELVNQLTDLWFIKHTR